jgi:hypothetical protein
MGVNMDGHIGKLLSERSNQDRRRLRLEQARHILDRQHVHAEIDQLSREVEIVLQRVAPLGRVGDVPGVADGRLDNPVRRAHRVDAEPGRRRRMRVMMMMMTMEIVIIIITRTTISPPITVADLMFSR